MFPTWLRRRLRQLSSRRQLCSPAARTFSPRLEALEDRVLLSVYTVINTNDSGDGSLRQAILNVNSGSGGDTIAFDINGGGVQTIHPLSALPTVTKSVTIDGTTQPGYNGSPLIELAGNLAGSSTDGLTITAGNSVVRGLDIDRFSGIGIRLEGSGGNRIESNFIGTDITGTQALGNSATGIFVFQASNNIIGGTDPGAGNLVSANIYGIYLLASNNNVVQGNKVGTDVTGTKAFGNKLQGVEVAGTGNLIGGTAAGAGNLVSGNSGSGVFLYGSSTQNNTVQGNTIGTDITGTQTLGNSSGVDIDNDAFNNLIGGTTSGAGNLISGNPTGVLLLSGKNTVQGNLIGTDSSGSQAVGNSTGIQDSAGGNTIGGTASGAGNVISGNADGIQLLSGSGTLVEGNYIGTGISGTQALANIRGIYCRASGDTIGGTATGAGNLISGNLNNGIELVQGASGDLIEGNLIGTDASGAAPLGNGGVGIAISASGNTVGGAATGASNVISANGASGVEISTGSGNLVQGNLIGTDASGTVALGNFVGVSVDTQAGSNTIGGTASGAGNVISGNRASGVLLASNGNIVQGNLIGTDITGSQALGNQNGLSLQGSNNTVGGIAAGAGNVISGNQANGVLISGTGEVIQGNDIGTDSTGTLALGNASNGVSITGSNNTIGGTSAAAGNTIAFNGNDGVLVNTGTGNAILSDLIFSSGNLGIELINNGNHNQAAPVLTSAVEDGVNTVIQGTLQSTPNTTFTVQFFSDPSVDPSGSAEGQQLLGTTTVTTDASGFASFTVTIPQVVPAGQVVTATATDANNNTSEFSAPVTVTAA
jgi:titin